VHFLLSTEHFGTVHFLLLTEHFGTVHFGTAHNGIDLVNYFMCVTFTFGTSHNGIDLVNSLTDVTLGTVHNGIDLVNSGNTPSIDLVKWTFAGKDGEIIPALCAHVFPSNKTI
jgi:hypothetical protein